MYFKKCLSKVGFFFCLIYYFIFRKRKGNKGSPCFIPLIIYIKIKDLAESVYLYFEKYVLKSSGVFLEKKGNEGSPCFIPLLTFRQNLSKQLRYQ